MANPGRLLNLTDSPAVAAGAGQAAILLPDGALCRMPSKEAARRLANLPPPLLVHAPATFRRLGMQARPALDLLELFAFVHPARPAAPTPRGLALALDCDPPGGGLEAAAALLPRLAQMLLTQLAAGRQTEQGRDAAELAAQMGLAGWSWAPLVTAALGDPQAVPAARALRVWLRLPEWQETAPPPPPRAFPVSAAEARRRLAEMLGPEAEHRPGQIEYAAAAAAAFAPRIDQGVPQLVLAEAGTGIGKTLGYIAPASLWAERNQGTVWVSTFTRHLQRQIEAELARLFPDPTTRRQRAVIRKGRENYLCLLNFEEAVNAATVRGPSQPLIALGLLARWAAVTADGDLEGGDLPGWFAELFGRGNIANLADRRGECIHSACPHWRRCFIEHSIRRAREADIVVANHALVMVQAAHAWNWGEGLDGAGIPLRYVFDEGHQIFHAADNAFATAVCGLETVELRRWLLGAEGSRSRARGLRRRLEELVLGRPELEAPLEAALQAARALPGPGWSARIAEEPSGSQLNALLPAQDNPTEAFLRVVRRQVLARNADAEANASGMTLEADLHPVLPELPGAAERLARALHRIAEPLKTLRSRLLARLQEEAETLEETLRTRIEAAARTLARRALDPLAAWCEMLHAVSEPEPEPDRRPEQVLFLRLERVDGLERDVALCQHWLDPTVPFAATLAAAAHGLLITSATLRDGGQADPVLAWETAEAEVGAVHLPAPALRVMVPSPFDYATQTRAFIVTDVPSEDLDALAGACRALFFAAGGGALGLFTAIRRLTAVHARIAPELEAAGIMLLAQHVDPMHNATLVDIFRIEEESCLLGTDAMRDGVDVPGRALRLVVFDKVPWPRPNILHRERRIHLSGGNPAEYEARIARQRLRQAFGRLIRRATDRGVFVLLDRRTPSRLLSAFPPGVQVARVGLAEAVHAIKTFLHVE